MIYEYNLLVIYLAVTYYIYSEKSTTVHTYRLFFIRNNDSVLTERTEQWKLVLKMYLLVITHLSSQQLWLTAQHQAS